MKVRASFFHRGICSCQRYGIGRTRIAMLVKMSGGMVPKYAVSFMLTQWPPGIVLSHQ